MSKKPTNMRLDEDTKKLIERLIKRLGGSRTSIVEQAVRVLARQEGISLDAEG